MPDGASPTLAPKEAIALGMKYFAELMEDQPTPRVLLEGLSLDEKNGNWIVTIGFDSERKKPQQGSALQAMVRAMASGLSEEFEVVREFRSVRISSSDGQFVKMEHA